MTRRSDLAVSLISASQLLRVRSALTGLGPRVSPANIALARAGLADPDPIESSGSPHRRRKRFPIHDEWVVGGGLSVT